ncbi:MAG TPA: hypothetical protein VFT84_07820 [Gemmatimonadales bacterium]|nr:hypothetical protein [Gemmatimonadales bacterium]
MIRRPLAALLLALAGAPAAGAQEYRAAELDCARYGESARSEIETESAGLLRRSRAEREGRWSFRARDSAGGILLEGWYDSLALRHGAGDTLTSPDTDGIIGGRYRGLLRPTGEFRRLAAPFVPDEVAEATDAAAALDDLFPRLPPAPMEPGRRWTDGAGLEIERLADSSAGGATLRRYALRRRVLATEAIPRGDTLPVPLRQTTTDEARLTWSPSGGLMRVERETVIDASIPAGGRIRTPVRSRVVQRAQLVRLPPSPSCR